MEGHKLKGTAKPSSLIVWSADTILCTQEIIRNAKYKFSKQLSEIFIEEFEAVRFSVALIQ